MSNHFLLKWLITSFAIRQLSNGNVRSPPIITAAAQNICLSISNVSLQKASLLLKSNLSTQQPGRINSTSPRRDENCCSLLQSRLKSGDWSGHKRSAVSCNALQQASGASSNYMFDNRWTLEPVKAPIWSKFWEWFGGIEGVYETRWDVVKCQQLLGEKVVKKMQDIHPSIQWELGPPNYLCDKWELTICAGSSSFLRERAPQWISVRRGDVFIQKNQYAFAKNDLITGWILVLLFMEGLMNITRTAKSSSKTLGFSIWCWPLGSTLSWITWCGPGSPKARYPKGIPYVLS